MADVRLVVHRTAIARMSLPGGQIFRWTRQRRERVVHLAKVFAPERSGRLKRSINGTYNPSGGPFSCRMEVQASVRHALFVHEGTTGPIWASNNDFLKLRPGNGWPTVYTRTVAGQSANPFLRHALEEVMGHL